MDFRVEFSDGYFIGTTSGDAAPETFGELLDAMLNHEKWAPGTPWLYDHTDLDTTSLTVGDIGLIAQLCSARQELVGNSRCAILVTADQNFGQAQMWAKYMESAWEVKSSVFDARDDALKWLTGK